MSALEHPSVVSERGNSCWKLMKRYCVGAGNIGMATDDELAALDSRVTALEAVETIKQLRHAFSTALDARDWEQFRSLFSQTPTVEFPEIDRPSIEGQEGIRDWCDAIESGYEFTFHMVHHPIIDVDGNSATGRWYFETATESRDGAELALGIYEDEYVEIDESWKIDRIQVWFRSQVEQTDRWLSGDT